MGLREYSRADGSIWIVRRVVFSNRTYSRVPGSSKELLTGDDPFLLTKLDFNLSLRRAYGAILLLRLWNEEYLPTTSPT